MVEAYDTAELQYEALIQRYSEAGLTEECSIWNVFFALRAFNFTSTATFCDKFRALSTKLDEHKLSLPEKGVIYQFIAAIDDTYPEYAKIHRSKLRQKKTISVNDMVQELCDEAKREDPLKAAAFASKNGKKTTATSQPQGKATKNTSKKNNN